jgi:hypothetical protein
MMRRSNEAALPLLRRHRRRHRARIRQRGHACRLSASGLVAMQLR